MNHKEKLIEIINNVIRCDKCGIVPEWLAEDLIFYGVTVQECISVDERLPEKCPHKSNGDNVREMNDEQLAEWALFRAIEIGKGYNHSLLGLIKWLKQPAEGE